MRSGYRRSPVLPRSSGFGCFVAPALVLAVPAALRVLAVLAVFAFAAHFVAGRLAHVAAAGTRAFFTQLLQAVQQRVMRLALVAEPRRLAEVLAVQLQQAEPQHLAASAALHPGAGPQFAGSHAAGSHSPRPHAAFARRELATARRGTTLHAARFSALRLGFTALRRTLAPFDPALVQALLQFFEALLHLLEPLLEFLGRPFAARRTRAFLGGEESGQQTDGKQQAFHGSDSGDGRRRATEPSSSSHSAGKVPPPTVGSVRCQRRLAASRYAASTPSAVRVQVNARTRAIAASRRRGHSGTQVSIASTIALAIDSTWLGSK